MKNFDDEKLICEKWKLCELKQNFRLVFNMGYACAMIVLTPSTAFDGF